MAPTPEVIASSLRDADPTPYWLDTGSRPAPAPPLSAATTADLLRHAGVREVSRLPGSGPIPRYRRAPDVVVLATPGPAMAPDGMRWRERGVAHLGAATAALNCMLATQAWQRGYAMGPRALLWGGSWNGLRGTMLLEQGRG